MGQKLNNAKRRLEKIRHLHDNGGNVDEALRVLHLIDVPPPTHKEHVQIFLVKQEAQNLIDKMGNET